MSAHKGYVVCHEQMCVNKTSCRSQKLTNWAIAMPTPTPAGNDANRRAIAILDLVGAESGVRTIRDNRNTPAATAAPASAHSHQEKRGWVSACPGTYKHAVPPPRGSADVVHHGSVIRNIPIPTTTPTGTDASFVTVAILCRMSRNPTALLLAELKGPWPTLASASTLSLVWHAGPRPPCSLGWKAVMRLARPAASTRHRHLRSVGPPRRPIGDHQNVSTAATGEEKAMAHGEETDGTPMAPDPVERDETDPDKDASATPTDDAGDPQNADLNAGALSQPTTTGTP